MKKQYILIVLSGVLVLFIFGFFAFECLHAKKNIDESRTVFVKKTEKGYQLFRNGTPFYIRGASGDSHFKELAEIGGNTIRVFDTISLGQTLDNAYKNNLAVIVDIPLAKYSEKYNSYLNEENNQILKQRVKILIRKYNNHPALLMWNLGNEVNYPFALVKNGFIKTFNELIDIIHNEDPNHPISTALIATDNRKVIASILMNSPNLDLLSFNIFGRIDHYNYYSGIINFLFGRMPYYISEWGSDGHWECENTAWRAPIEPTSAKKAEQIKNRYKLAQRNDGASLGSLVFYWGQKQEITHTWFSIFDDQGRKSQTYYELQKVWGYKTINIPSAPAIRYMLIGKKGARDNLVFKPNDIREAHVFFDGEPDSTLQFNWEIYEEGWNYYGANAKQKKPKQISSCFDYTNDSIVSFRVPAIEGPYRIFTYVYDKNGNFATTNTPFYVLDNK
jgi:hypothetical protein